MNYFEHHIGDYAAATGHLSMVEDAAYSRMLRRYYMQEGPLPGDWRQVARLVGAREEAECDAVKAVLLEFFTLDDDGYHQKRADEAIAAFHERQSGKAAEREAETERKRRYRERRSELFAQLREIGIVPAFDTATDELVRVLSRGTGRGRDADGTATQAPSTNYQSPVEQELSAQPAASRFGEWWSAYPKKVGRKKAEQLWGRRKLDAIADRLVADVLHRAANDDGWQRGYAPDPCTYINQDRWDDDLRAAPLAAIAAPGTSKTLTGMKSLQEMKNGLVHERDHRRPDEAHVLELGQDACRRLGADHGADVD